MGDQKMIPETTSSEANNKSTKWKAVIYIISVIILFVVGIIVLEITSTGIISFNHDPVDRSVIDSFKSSNNGGDRIYSWDTWAGRIYAVQCAGPPYDATYNSELGFDSPCGSICFDGGTYFYDASGKQGEYCGSWGGENDSWWCTKWLNKLTEKDADFRDPDCLSQ